jgi:hypothetical protein
MEHYIYEGPVLGLSRVISEKWRGETYAVSDKKAKGNLGYQFKRQNGLAKGTKIFLPYNLLKE